MHLKHVEELSDKLRQGTITETEEQELYAFYDSFEDNTGFTHLLQESEREIYRDTLLRQIYKRTSKHRKLRRLYWSVSAAAAVLLLLLANLFYFKRDSAPVLNLAEKFYSPQEIAMLTTSDGQTYTLGESGLLGEVGSGLELSRRTDGFTDILIHPSQSSLAHKPIHIQVAKGHVYHLALSDGTKIRMEPGSELFIKPTFEKDSQRQVRLLGEARFDVAHDAQRPFVVSTPLQQVRVLGTEFSVAAYPERSEEKVSLYQGRVKLSATMSKATTILAPGQSAQLKPNGDAYQLQSLSMAGERYTHNWKFHDEHLAHLAANLERWFDVKIDVDKSIANKTFTGVIPQNMSLKSILDALKETEHIHYVLKDDTIYIIPN